MDFAVSPLAQEYLRRVRAFMSEHVYPTEDVYARQRDELTAQGRPNDQHEDDQNADPSSWRAKTRSRAQ